MAPRKRRASISNEDTIALAFKEVKVDGNAGRYELAMSESERLCDRQDERVAG